MKNRMTVSDLYKVIAKDTGFSPAMISGYSWSYGSSSLTKHVGYLLEECNAACAWLNVVYRTQNVNRLARGSLLKVRAGAYAGHYISDSALSIAARHMGFKVLREADEFYLNVSKRSIPDCIDGAFPPGSVEYIRNWHSRRIQGGRREHYITKLPNSYKREW